MTCYNKMIDTYDKKNNPAAATLYIDLNLFNVILFILD